MTDRIIRNRSDVNGLIALLNARELPVTVSIRKGADRTVDQNRLQRMWLNEAVEQLGDRTAEELRGYLKLTIGVPIMRAASEDFREKYDRIIKPLPYETKVEMMMEPLDFPVTRLMTTKEATEYLDQMHRHLTVDMGCQLTEPKR